MPNGGTDNCMNCAHNRANQQSTNVKSAPSQTRLAFCGVHQIPVWDRAWTYCSNIRASEPDVTVLINTIGLHSEGYARIPWFGRTPPVRTGQIERCEVCGSGAEEGLVINSEALGIDVSFCSNAHYVEWYERELESRGFERSYQIGRTALHEAVLNTNPDAIDSLVADKSLLNQSDYFGWTALHLAAYLGYERGVGALVSAGADVKSRDLAGKQPIDLAGSEGFESVVSRLLSPTFSGVPEQESALLQAATDGNLELVEALINAGAPMECADYRGQTPLLLAVWGNHYTTTVFLLDHGANVHVEDQYGNTPLKTVDTWNSRQPNELHRLIHEWVGQKSRS